MYNLKTLKNGLNLITINLPHLDSVTTMVIVGSGSRYEDRKTSGLSHFLEHMFFKGSKKYPSAEKLATIIDGIGAVNNASTGKEYTYYWIKSSSKHLELSADILSSMIKEPLLLQEEIEKEKGVIVEELRMYHDNPSHYVWELYDMLQFGDQPLGWDIGGEEEIITKFNRQNFLDYMKDFYSPRNMALVFVGKLPENIEDLANKYYQDLPKFKTTKTYPPFKDLNQKSPNINIFYKKTDSANLVLGVKGYDRYNPQKYPARILGLILGGGMSSRLFLEVREKRGLAYHISAGHESFMDTGAFVTSAGIKLEKLEEGVKVIVDQLEKIATTGITPKELVKAKEMERGRLALRAESTNFLAEYFGIKYILDKKLESFDQYLEKIDKVEIEDVQNIAKDLFQKNLFNLQIIAPLKDKKPFEKIFQ